MYADGARMLSDVAFFFEIDGTGVQRHGLSIAEQEDHVRNVYLKKLSAHLGTARAHVCVDLSHWTLLYFEGLISVMRAARLPFKLVRIHRDAIETARSLDNSFSVGYRPFDARESLQLRVDAAVSSAFSPLESGLYDVDETEALWRKILSNWNSGVILTCHWSEYSPLGLGFVDECVHPIARFLGLKAAPAVPVTKDHHNPRESAAARYNDIALLLCYRSKMSASSTYRWLGQSLPSGHALRNRMGRFSATTGAANLSDPRSSDCMGV